MRDRLIWLREEHPDAQIQTYLVNFYPDTNVWVVRAEISYLHESGLEARGSGHGQESEKDFPAGALEKAETKAIGRALATLGYGTQFALEIDEGERIVDSPVQAKKLTPAGVEELRESVIEMLEKDADAKQRLPKGAGELTEEELTKTASWLRLRAISRT